MSKSTEFKNSEKLPDYFINNFIVSETQSPEILFLSLRAYIELNII